jgi:uncharacterized phage-associated protein
MYKAINLSKYIVSKCIKDNIPISNLQLQKILFYIQKSFLKKRGEVAFGDVIEAWQFGPVVPNVYYYYCGFGAMPISYSYDSYYLESEEDLNIVNEIIEAKRELNPWDLVAETHKKNGAWDKIYNDGSGNHAPIPVELIKAEA